MAVKQRKTVERQDVGKHIKEISDYISSRDVIVSTATTNGAHTYTAANFVNAVVLRSGTAGAANDVTPTATELLAAMNNPAIGDTFSVVIRNLNTTSGAITLFAGTGVTLSGTTTCAINKTRTYTGVVTATSTPAVTLYGVSLADV